MKKANINSSVVLKSILLAAIIMLLSLFFFIPYITEAYTNKSIAKYVQNGYNGFVIPDWSSTELQRILTNIVTLSRDDINRMKSNSDKCARDEFHYLNYVDRMNDFIAKLK